MVHVMNQSAFQATAATSPSPRTWSAQLHLEFARRAGRTRLDRNQHSGPLRVQRLFHPEVSGKAHCYLLHPPGGVVLGDELSINAALHSGAALLTTPSAGRFYSVGDHAERQCQRVHLEVHKGLLEWLPQETILFNGSNARLETRIDLDAGASLAFWDVVVLGRPACGEGFTRGQLEQRLDLRRGGRPLLSERLALTAGDRLSASRIGLHGASTLGIALFSDLLDEGDVDAWLAAHNGDDAGPFSVTERAGLLIARYRGNDAYRCRQGFAALWSATSRARDGVTPEIPRIWHT